MTKDPMSAAGALDSGGDASAGGGDADQMQEGQEQQSGGGEGTFFIPKDVCEGMTYKAGDKLELTVVGTDEDGDLEVKMAGGSGEGGGDWRDELRTEMADKEGAAA